MERFARTHIVEEPVGVRVVVFGDGSGPHQQPSPGRAWLPQPVGVYYCPLTAPCG